MTAQHLTKVGVQEEMQAHLDPSSAAAEPHLSQAMLMVQSPQLDTGNNNTYLTGSLLGLTLPPA